MSPAPPSAREREIRALAKRRPQTGDCCGEKAGMIRDLLLWLDTERTRSVLLVGIIEGYERRSADHEQEDDNG